MILVTGGLGYIGSNLTYELLKKDFHVTVLDNLSNVSVNHNHFFQKNFKSKFRFFNIDLVNYSALKDFFEHNKFKYIFHLASLKSVSESILNPELYRINNEEGSRNLIDLCYSDDLKGFIFSSSATVYGQPMINPIDEAHSLNPLNPYAKNKLAIEKMLIEKFDNKIFVAILRYFNPVGTTPKTVFFDSPKHEPTNLMPYLIEVAKKKKPFLNVYGSDYNTHDGSGVRDYIHVFDLVKAHIATLNKKLSGINIFNIGTGKGYSVFDVIKTFEQVNNIHIPFKIVNKRIGDVEVAFANPSKAQRILGWKSKYGLEEMCLHSWNR